MCSKRSWLWSTAFIAVTVVTLSNYGCLPTRNQSHSATSAEQSVAPTLAATRAPAYPLITHDPYFSIWSFTDQLSDSWPRHWSGANHALASMIRIDGKAFRLMGMMPQDLPVMPQLSASVTPTRTIYRFGDAQVNVVLTFLSPLLASDLHLMSRPVSYISWRVTAVDHRPHDVSLYFDNSAESVVVEADKKVTWSKENISGVLATAIGSKEQNILGRTGDRIGIDWGYLYQAAPDRQDTHQTVAAHNLARDSFAKGGELPPSFDTRMPRAANDDFPVIATTIGMGRVGAEGAERFLVLAYDDLWSVEHMGTRLRAYWRATGMGMKDLIRTAISEFPDIQKRCLEFDEEFMTDMAAVGGTRFAKLGSLAYRQSIAAHKLVLAADGKTPLFFSKENSSNGCMATVDVAFPAAPLYLLLNPALLRAMLDPIFTYAASGRWRFPFAPHDLGYYPKANGQVYGGGEASETDQMPVEESADMIIMVAAIVKAERRPNYAAAHLGLLSKWANYLKQQGYDPPNQLSTEDFAGHLAHSVNLSAKSIVALAAYADLSFKLGNKSEGEQFAAVAREFAEKWQKGGNDGDHYRLAFDRPGTWSQKYNLIWQKLLGLQIFPEHIFDAEYAFYLTKMNQYGTPLDSRISSTISMWNVSTGMFTGKRQDFDRMASPIYDFADQTTDRIPLTDWLETTRPIAAGFQARSTVGGLFIPMLGDAAIWQKWLGKVGLDQPRL